MSYKSCELLRHSIQFWFDFISICDYSDERGYQYSYVKRDYKGEKLDWDNLLESRSKLVESFKNGEYPRGCDICRNLISKDWDDYEPYINTFFITNWSQCNSNCIYCNNRRYNHIKPYKIMPILHEMNKNGIIRFDGSLTMGGGEPTKFGELDKVLNFFYANNIADVQIFSSGIDYNKTIAKYLSLKQSKLMIAPDSGTKQTYEYIKRVKKYDAVWNNIKKYAKAQGDNKYALTVKYIIIPGVNDNKAEIEMWINKCVEAGVRFVMLDLESSWFVLKYDKIPSEIYSDLIPFFKELAAKFELGSMLGYYLDETLLKCH